MAREPPRVRSGGRQEPGCDSAEAVKRSQKIKGVEGRAKPRAGKDHVQNGRALEVAGGGEPGAQGRPSAPAAEVPELPQTLRLSCSWQRSCPFRNRSSPFSAAPGLPVCP